MIGERERSWSHNGYYFYCKLGLNGRQRRFFASLQAAFYVTRRRYLMARVRFACAWGDQGHDWGNGEILESQWLLFLL
jgi:hypothetical protein